MNAIDHLYSRTAGLPEGPAKVSRNILSAVLSFTDDARSVRSNEDYTTKGKAKLLDTVLRTAVATFARGQRQAEYRERVLERMRSDVRAKAIGPEQPRDEEHRRYLRELPMGERIQRVMENPDARGAALREPSLVKLPDDVRAQALESAIRANAAAEAAELELHERAHEIHNASLRMLEIELLRTPAILEGNNLRQFSSRRELDSFITRELPKPAPVTLASEEKEVDER